MIGKIITLVIGWKIFLLTVAAIAVFIIPNFGGKFPYYHQTLDISGLPAWIWGFGNFDGVHYLRIAQNGYSSEYAQAFFPLYPLFVKMFAENSLFLFKDPLIDKNIFVDPIYLSGGLILSSLVFLTGLIFFYKLVNLDYNKETSWKTIILLLAFPTAFYFSSIYSESLFFLLVVICLYLFRKKYFLTAGIFAGFASATKILGILLFPVMLVELYLMITKKEFNMKSSLFVKGMLGVLMSSFGLISYAVYLKIFFNNPVYFLTAQPVFGAQRSSEPFILLPQVLYRYLKIFMTVPVNSLPFFNAALEFIFTLIPLIILVVFYKKIRFSYWIFTFGCLIIPTLTGTLSSMPRYALMSFLIFPFVVENFKSKCKMILFVFIFIQAILVSMFIRGYWVA